MGYEGGGYVGERGVCASSAFFKTLGISGTLGCYVVLPFFI